MTMIQYNTASFVARMIVLPIESVFVAISLLLLLLLLEEFVGSEAEFEVVSFPRISSLSLELVVVVEEGEIVVVVVVVVAGLGLLFPPEEKKPKIADVEPLAVPEKSAPNPSLVLVEASGPKMMIEAMTSLPAIKRAAKKPMMKALNSAQNLDVLSSSLSSGRR